MDIPEYVRDDFGDFYKAMFDEQVKRNDMRAVFTEYVWNMGWCDPCAGPPLSRDELKSLGVFWLDDENGGTPRFRPGGFMPYQPMGGAMPVTLTRLHVRYSAETFPEDLIFQETQDQENFQARYVMHRRVGRIAQRMRGGQKLFRRSEQAPSARSGDARRSDGMESGGRDQEGRAAAGVTAEAMVEGYLGIVKQR